MPEGTESGRAAPRASARRKPAPRHRVPDDGEIRAASELLTAPIFTLTGAGMSTDSGIPDYRGPGSPPRNPMTYQQFTASESARARYWARSFVGWSRFDKATPNAGHFAVAAMAHRLTGVVTQNVDGLHEEAGSTNVVDLHGRLDRVVCLECGTTFDRDLVQQWLAEANPHYADRLPQLLADIDSAPDGDAELDNSDDFHLVPCPVSGGVLKPDVVFFGESVPRDRVDAAYAQLARSASVLVLGSSLAVMSGLRFVIDARKRGLPVVVVNDGPTRAGDRADLHLDAGVAEFLSRFAA
ncbi:Sir2 family NAD-dependent protein deacetylase [Spelaeicoccus albus]|uniref:protein acetyllysine N-acetyltransferase n=1 Tax=Spelaeicoccus albus TaxID=1280376 RepID=A0A7Z0III5_9MICO|nr:Sir2 family NAD-dependent protein deacetylase [Spelaeicoccus albus]NYI68525.1 NAD-dependent SIR2 family protein deacetylase [Spelaeicoccus albus]